MNNNIELIILHRNNTPEIIESLVREARAVNIDCICIDIEITKNSLELPNKFYLFYSVLLQQETESFISLLPENIRLIHYTFGRRAALSESSELHVHQIPYASIKYNDNHQLLKNIDEIGGFPVLFSSDKFSNSLGKYYVENEAIYLHIIDTIRNKDEFDYILKYIEHDFHIRVYIVNYQYNSAVIYYKYKNDYSTNRLDREKRPNMSFCTHVSADIKKLAINHARYLHVETAGIDILVSKNNEYFILEANNPMMYHVVPESLPIVSKAIIQGLLNKFEGALSPALHFDSSVSLVLSNKFVANEHDYLEIILTCKQLNISIVSEEEALQSKKIMILNSKYCPSYFACRKQSLGFNTLTADPISKSDKEFLEQHNIYEWRKYNIKLDAPNQLKPGDLETCCQFPALVKVEVETDTIKYFKVDTVKQCISLISIYKDERYGCSIYPYIYLYVKRKALLVGGEIVAVIESVQAPERELFNTSNTISLELDQISEQERSAFKIISDLCLFQGGWTLEYAIDIQSGIHILSYDNGYELDDFRSATSDLLIPKIINKLWVNAHLIASN